MPFFAAIAPYVAAGSAVVQQVQAQNTATYNAGVTKNQQNLAIDQANAQATQVQRAGREALGRQEAAFGASNVGYGGSSGAALDQSAINSELDVLNTRYKGAITGYGYGQESQLDQQNAKSYGLLAGAALLKGAGANYTFSPSSATTPQPSAASVGNAGYLAGGAPASTIDAS